MLLLSFLSCSELVPRYQVSIWIFLRVEPQMSQSVRARLQQKLAQDRLFASRSTTSRARATYWFSLGLGFTGGGIKCASRLGGAIFGVAFFGFFFSRFPLSRFPMDTACHTSLRIRYGFL